MPNSGLAWDCQSIEFCHVSFSWPAFSRHRWRGKGPNQSRALSEATLIVRDKAKARTRVLWLIIPGCFLDTPSQPPHSLNYLSRLQTCNPFVEIKAKRKQPKILYIVQTPWAEGQTHICYWMDRRTHFMWDPESRQSPEARTSEQRKGPGVPS